MNTIYPSTEKVIARMLVENYSLEVDELLRRYPESIAFPIHLKKLVLECGEAFEVWQLTMSQFFNCNWHEVAEHCKKMILLSV